LHINVHPTYAFTENHSICNGDTYNWHGTNYSSANTYTANYATVNGCDSIYTLNLSVHTVDVSTAAMAATITASASGLVYQWLDCNSGNSVLAGETNQSFTATAIGDYAVMITDNGCIDTSSCISILSVGIQELNDNNITFYPNPFTTQLIIHFATEQKNTSIKITDVQGKEIKTISGINGKQVIIDKGETEDGIYFMHVINENGTVLNRKIVIQ
jgi:hypothetical protein